MTYTKVDLLAYNDVNPTISPEEVKSSTRESPQVETQVTEALPPLISEHSNKKATFQSPMTTDQLIDAVALILNDLMTAKCKNFNRVDEIPSLTVFHAKTMPQISLKDYIKRFMQYAQCSDVVLIYALIYLDKIGERCPEFSVDSFNVHKLLLISLSTACKFAEDKYFTNSYYANIGGISVQDFNALELDYLMNYLHFNLFVRPEVSETYYNDVSTYYINSLVISATSC